MNYKKDFNYYYGDTPFELLMKKRIGRVLLICSKYDSFMLDEDGRIDEQIFMEYASLNLRYPPQFVQVSTANEAFQTLADEDIDLIINMLSVGGMDPFQLSLEIKAKYPKIPIVVLTPFSREVSIKLQNKNLNAIDYKFCWLGKPDILLAIVKLLEDKMNSDNDINSVGVKAILLVEDSIRYYSSFLPSIYKIIFTQSKVLMDEGLNEHQKMLRMRGRPKILLANNYEEAILLWEKYKNNMLGIISDVSFNRNGEKDKYAGWRFVRKIKEEDKLIPILLQSSDMNNKEIARRLGIDFLHKYSNTLYYELRDFIVRNFAFGDFIFKNPANKEEIARAKDLKTLQKLIFKIPDETIKYHIDRNHFSKWLNARAFFSLGKFFKNLKSDDFNDIKEVKNFINETFSKYRTIKGKGVITEFTQNTFDNYVSFARIGEDSLGGKGRGLAFLDSLIRRNKFYDRFENVAIKIPRTVVLCSDIFDEFMESNNLYSTALSDIEDELILKAFVEASFPKRIEKDLIAFLRVIDGPIAIRSSSLLEDSHYQPFAGVYSTYMIPKVKPLKFMIEKLEMAIKSVYASVFYKESKAYMQVTSNVIDEEKMAVVLQEVCGTKYGNHFYPKISGTARSINFYPLNEEKPEDGIVNIALGLGKQIVEGGESLRFSPKYPKKIVQLYSPEMALRSTQKTFFALDLNIDTFKISTNDGINLKKLDINDAIIDGTLNNLVSTFDYNDNVLVDGFYEKGAKVLTFANILKYNLLPLSEIVDLFLKTGQSELNNPVEIEFALDFNSKAKNATFNILQIRPIIESELGVEIDLNNINNDDIVVLSNSSLGHGEYNDICDIIYVKPDSFDSLKTLLIAETVDNLNKKFKEEKKNYILIGPGRWGSSDPNLGIPVRWSQISNAFIIIESGLKNYRIDPSQGTHFFQNLTSFGIGYFTINPYINDGYYNIDWLNSLTPKFENEFVRHIQFDKPLTVKVDGKKSIGIILK